MNLYRLSRVLGAGLLLTAPLRAGETSVVKSVKFEWRDDARARAVPAKIYYPASGTGACPVIVFSHGLGGSRDGYAYLGECWASNGFVSVHLQHVGSDDSAWRGQTNAMESMRAAAANPKEILDRPRDVKFALDQLEALNRTAGSPLRGRLDLKRVGVAGHSFGAYTALAAAGRVFSLPGGREFDLHDARITACIALSAPARGTPAEKASYAKFAVPCLHMTGTEDTSPIGDTKAEQRRIPYDAIAAPAQYLVNFQGGDHMIFSGRPKAGERTASDAEYQKMIRTCTLAFWNAYLKNDAVALAWLQKDGLPQTLGAKAKLERK